MISFSNVIDDILGGGLHEGIITHFYGPPASGKTNIALIAVAQALGSGKVIYVDPEGSFSTERLKQISGERFNAVLNNTLVLKPTTFEEQRAALDQIEQITTSMKVSLIIIDSIAMLYRMEEDKDVRILGRMMAQLLRIARKYNLPILLTNQVYSDYETNIVRPTGGTITEYFTKNIVELVRRLDGGRYMVLRRHQSKHEGQAIEFKIEDKGIVATNEFCTTERQAAQEIARI